ncbi:hypothetical protein CC80DRAFT_537811 [Byssothecium circinans]|uniref:F-box domain-containing protein n=1 Tax=Byssothecium circinans TaxID=147558 RepID=A0A6A5TJJ0_9PLEO|nr:hypothetical protein CC80DRAFT_537811 [Byssothecium circinans]
MARAVAALDTLPTELLHRIAASLSCSSINLCFSNRTLYVALYDRLVFKRSAVDVLFVDKYHELPELEDVHVEDWELQSCASEASMEDSEDEDWWSALEEEVPDPGDDWDYADWGPDERQRKASASEDGYLNWSQASIFHALSSGDSARIAFAVEKANRLFNVAPHDQPWNRMKQWENESLVTWLPHLIALRHNSVMALRPEAFQLIIWAPSILEAIEEDGSPVRSPSYPDYVAVGFCMVALLLKRAETIFPGDRGMDGFEAIREFFWSRRIGCVDIEGDLKRTLEESWDALKFDFKDR